MTRRDMLKSMLLGAQTLVSVPLLSEIVEAGYGGNRYSGKLSIYNKHTEEFLSVQYLDKKGRFDQKACRLLNRLFRCPYDNTVYPINYNLFLLLDEIRHRLRAKDRPYVLYSGYRSPTYNRILAHQDGGVARHSYHTKGMAADVELENVSLRAIGKIAKAVKEGGVGTYDNFIHLDVGPVRTW